MTRKANCHPDKPHSAKGLCKSCYMKQRWKRPEVRQRAKDRRVDNEQTRRRNKMYMLRALYGISLEDYDRLVITQRGLCAVCFKPEKAKHQSGRIRSLSVDHDHSTKRVRGLLCGHCNTSIGQLEKVGLENVERMIRYIRGGQRG